MDTITISQRPTDGAVLRATGDLDLVSQRPFETSVISHLNRGWLVVDLTNLDFLAISGLRSLLLCHRHAITTGRTLTFAGVPRQAKRLLGVSGVDQVLALRRSVATACAGLPPSAGQWRSEYWSGGVREPHDS